MGYELTEQPRCTCGLCHGGLERLQADIGAFDPAVMIEVMKEFDYALSLRVMRMRCKLIEKGLDAPTATRLAKKLLRIVKDGAGTASPAELTIDKLRRQGLKPILRTKH